MLYSSLQWWSVDRLPTLLDGGHLSVNVWEH